jgi:hypothetical protein
MKTTRGLNDWRGGEGAKGIIKVSGVVIYIMDGKRYQGPTTGSLARSWRSTWKKEIPSGVAGKFKMSLDVILMSFPL